MVIVKLVPLVTLYLTENVFNTALTHYVLDLAMGTYVKDVHFELTLTIIPVAANKLALIALDITKLMDNV